MVLFHSSVWILWHWDAAVGSLTVPANGSVNQGFLVNSQLNLLTNIQLRCGTSNLAEKERIQQCPLCDPAHNRHGVDK